MPLSFGEVDGFDGDKNDFAAAGVVGSWAVGKNIALFGSLGGTVVDTTSGGFDDDLEVVELALGVNPHFPIGRNVDIVIPVAFPYSEAENGPFTEDDTGYSIGIGVRALFNPSLELDVGVQHVDIFGGDEQTIAGDLRWHITGLFSLALGASASDDVTAGRVGMRFTF